MNNKEFQDKMVESYQKNPEFFRGVQKGLIMALEGMRN